MDEERALPGGWAIKQYSPDSGAVIKGPRGSWDIDGDTDDAETLFWAIWDAAQTPPPKGADE